MKFSFVFHRLSLAFFGFALGAFVVAGLADMITFAMVPAHAVPLVEVNPIARTGGVVGIVLPKIIYFGFVGSALWTLSKCGFPRSFASIVLLVFATMASYCAWTNVVWGWTA